MLGIKRCTRRSVYNRLLHLVVSTYVYVQVTKKHLKNERTYRDGMPKKQPNKVGMTPQYSYGLSSLYLLAFFQLGLISYT